MIQKHAIPILEFDDNPQAVIMPNHEGLDLQLPKKCIYAFLEEVLYDSKTCHSYFRV